MTYSATYDADDMDDIGLDIVGNFGAKFVPYIALVLLVWILALLVKRTKHIGK